MSRVYIHEFVDVVGTARAKYQHHMTANWCPEAGPPRPPSRFGVFPVAGPPGRVPQVVHLWADAAWGGPAHNHRGRVGGCGALGREDRKGALDAQVWPPAAARVPP